MKKIVKQNITIQREEYNNETLRKMFEDNPFKIEIMDEKLPRRWLIAYRQGNFIDLCRSSRTNTSSTLVQIN